MPNGADKNWRRFCVAVEEFRVRYHHWPTSIRVDESLIKDLLTPQDFARLKTKITIISEGIEYIAEDERGNSYNYSKDGFSFEKPVIRAEEWLGVHTRSDLL